jgi:methylated-DNA-[protein]-cysteine S-methyltransferase
MTSAIYFWESIPDTPLGRIELICSRLGLTEVYFAGCTKIPNFDQFECGHLILTEAGHQIHAYLKGKLCQFSIPIDWNGMTSFSTSVRKKCCEIPYGETISYSELAAGAGFPGKARAVGNVNSHNPLPLVIPCHRVVGKDGSLRGYAGPQGIETKRWLLKMEKTAVSLND